MSSESIIKTSDEYDVRNLESLLEKSMDESLTIVDYTVNSLVPLGENFASTMLKIKVKLQRSKNSQIEVLHLVGKTIIVGESIFDWAIMIRREAFMYTDIVKLYERIELESSMHEKDTIINCFPIYYGHRISLDPTKEEADKDALILLENLQFQGYYVMDKRIGLDLQHATIAIKTLARFHALGIAAKINHPSEFETIRRKAIVSGFKPFDSADGIIRMIKFIRENPHFNEYADRMKEIEERMKNMHKFEPPRNEPWSTIVHGDYWTNNILFHDDESGSIDSLKVIDFQAYNFADLFVDLPYFLCTSLQDDVALNYFDHLIDTYHQVFVETLENLGVETAPFCREKFDEQLKKDAILEFVHCVMALFFFTVEIDENIKNKDDLMMKIFALNGNDLLYQKLTIILRIYERNGWWYDNQD